MRSSKNEEYSADEEWYNWCNKNILYPFIQGIRKIKYPERSESSKLKPEMAAVSWCNGAIEQISNIMSEEIRNLDKIYKIIRMKHSPARTTREQAVDGASSFK